MAERQTGVRLLGGTDPMEEVTPALAPRQPYSSACSSSLWLSSLFFGGVMNNDNKNEKASGMTDNYRLCD